MPIRPLSPELQELAIKELNEDPKRVQEDLDYIKSWLQKQPHINARTDDQWLICFLRGCKYSLEKTKEKIDFFYASRTLVPEFYNNKDPFNPIIQECLKKGFALPLLMPTTDGRSAMIIRGSLYEPGKIEADVAFKMAGVICDVLLNEDDRFVVAGYHAIVDMQFLNMSKVTAITPAFLKKMVVVMTKAFPIRPRGMYFINMPSYFEGLFKIMWSFFPDKIKSRVKPITKDNYKELFDVFPKNSLPPEYGGNGQSLEKLIEFWKGQVEGYRDWFLEDAKYKSDEKKRPGKPKTSADVFGIEGSFRKLDVD